jgi:hypothetical protein
MIKHALLQNPVMVECPCLDRYGRFDLLFPYPPDSFLVCSYYVSRFFTADIPVTKGQQVASLLKICAGLHRVIQRCSREAVTACHGKQRLHQGAKCLLAD